MHKWPRSRAECTIGKLYPSRNGRRVEALELQVRLLMTRLEQSEHEVHALREEIQT